MLPVWSYLCISDWLRSWLRLQPTPTDCRIEEELAEDVTTERFQLNLLSNLKKYRGICQSLLLQLRLASHVFSANCQQRACPAHAVGGECARGRTCWPGTYRYDQVLPNIFRLAAPYRRNKYNLRHPAAIPQQCAMRFDKILKMCFWWYIEKQNVSARDTPGHWHTWVGAVALRLGTTALRN